eukprot:TRINITY_DN2616_c0_g1_i2.p1 TRINITY_DN2616_c0_g1~~TRINITY_DN2616_c0_g1_i2.p1  ORF type:complete len:390 (-),score=104.91 TRINITY_DN2616_c0_g1_i2:29-1198(-)
MIMNPDNMESVNEMVRKEITDAFYQFLGNVYVTIGLIEGKTLLPMPPLPTNDVSRIAKDKEMVHLLESAVITWIRQIKNVLQSDPEDAFQGGERNPGPLEEVDFWETKSQDLNSLYSQTISLEVRRVVKVLEVTKSTYSAAFSRLSKEVQIARAEANNNFKFLRPLRKYFDQLHSSKKFTQLVQVFQPMMHMLLMVWTNSKFYNTPFRMVLMLRSICNDLIDRAIEHIDSDTLFKIDPEDALERLSNSMHVCGTFKACYFAYKASTQQDPSSVKWNFQNNSIFHRLDAFLERCHDVLELTQTIVQFKQLAKVNVGGSKGRVLSDNIAQIHADFEQSVQQFQNVPYDLLDVEAKAFDDSFYEFRSQIKMLEKRVSSVGQSITPSLRRSQH